MHNYLGNERADKLARNFAYHNIVNFSIEPPFREVKTQVNQELMKDWDREWSLENNLPCIKNIDTATRTCAGYVKSRRKRLTTLLTNVPLSYRLEGISLDYTK